jgi:uncharacterized membrane protein YfcA
LPESAEAVLLLLAAGFAGGVVNAAAGGAKLFVFPLLLASGLPPIAANATGTVAMWPATIPAVFVQRDLFGTTFRARPLPILVSILGAAGGALTLLTIGERVFMDVVPFLLGLATLSIGLGRHVRLLVPKGVTLGPNHPVALALLFAIAFYGGFFGAGMGILMIAALAIQGFKDVHEVNALKNWLSAVIYSVAVVTFVIAGAVSWPHTLVMIGTATLGGYWGATVARRLPAIWLRRFIIGVGGLLTVYYFAKTL